MVSGCKLFKILSFLFGLKDLYYCGFEGVYRCGYDVVVDVNLLCIFIWLMLVC